MTKLTFVYTNLNTSETERVDFDNKSQMNDFFNPDYMYPICTFTKTFYKGGAYTASDYSYCV